ncbi:hypothetical protein Y695_02424 [Hydrogenophaga sp. T4]|nr:hypothetical protein Y695_02424 [Hydrogenophaga sp. T4]
MATLDAVVAFVTPDGVVADAGDEDVIAAGAAQHHVFVTGVLQVVAIRARRGRVVADDQGHQGIGAHRVGIAEVAIELDTLVHFQDQAWGLEHQGRQVHRIGVERDQLGERIVFQFREEVRASQAVQVVKPVPVLQGL